MEFYQLLCDQDQFSGHVAASQGIWFSTDRDSATVFKANSPSEQTSIL